MTRRKRDPKKQDVETMLRRDFYREFESSLTSNEEK